MGLSTRLARSYVSSMRWVDLFVIDTFLASGQRAVEHLAQGEDGDPEPLADGTERIERIEEALDGDEDDDDGWDAETLDEIPEDLEIPAEDAFGRDVLRRLS